MNSKEVMIWTDITRYLFQSILAFFSGNVRVEQIFEMIPEQVFETNFQYFNLTLHTFFFLSGWSELKIQVREKERQGLYAYDAKEHPVIANLIAALAFPSLWQL